MKKLSLKNLKFEGNDMLQRNQLKTVFGGYGGGGDCTVLCNDDTRHDVPDCSSSTASTACSGHDGPNSCAGAATICDV